MARRPGNQAGKTCTGGKHSAAIFHGCAENPVIMRRISSKGYIKVKHSA
jgi:hypothetical protein